MGETLAVEVAFTVGGDGTLQVNPSLGTVSVFDELSASTSLDLTGASVVGLHEYLTLDVASLVGTGVYGLSCPIAGTITKIQSRLKGVLTTGDAWWVPTNIALTLKEIT